MLPTRFHRAKERPYSEIRTGELRLCDLPIRQRAVVTQVQSEHPMALRLMELGFYPGRQICRRYETAHGALSAYQVQGACIALRRTDAAAIRVSRL